jgi:pilus assembly protein Flp/PilA
LKIARRSPNGGGWQLRCSVNGDGHAGSRSDKGEVHMKSLIARLVRDDQGQDLIEYVLIGSFVSIGALAGATALGTQLNTWYNNLSGWVGDQATIIGAL